MVRYHTTLYDQWFIHTHEKVTTRGIGVYEWRTIDNLVDSKYLLELFKLHQEGYDTIYLSLNDALQMPNTTYMKALDRYVATVEGDGFTVDAVAGDPSWAMPSNYAKMGELLQFLANYNNEMPHPIRALNFDVEPYVMNPSSTSAQVIAALEGVVAYVNVTAQAQKTGARIGYTLPFWIACTSTVCSENDLLGNISKLPNSFVTVMAYRNATTGTNGSIALARSFFVNITRQRLHLDVYIDQDVSHILPSDTTFYGMTQNNFKAALYSIDRAYTHDIAYHGIIINDLAALSQR
jgi:hypothetical protein